MKFNIKNKLIKCAIAQIPATIDAGKKESIHFYFLKVQCRMIGETPISSGGE